MSKIGNYVVGLEEEVDRLASAWIVALDEATSIRKEIIEANVRLDAANERFYNINVEWIAYEELHGEQE